MPQTSLYWNVYSSFVYNHPNLETTQIPLKKRMDKVTDVFTHELVMCLPGRLSQTLIWVERPTQEGTCSLIALR